jgi:hypothetical protein
MSVISVTHSITAQRSQSQPIIFNNYQEGRLIALIEGSAAIP